MKLLWLDLNSSYAHSSLALPALHAQVQNNANVEWDVVSATINENIGMIVNEIAGKRPDVIASTCWLFNRDVLLQILARVNALLPGCMIVLGGPEFLGDNDDFIEQYPFIDAVFRGEGEKAFGEWLAYWDKPDLWFGIPGICCYERKKEEFKASRKNREDAYFVDEGKAIVESFSRLKAPETSRFFRWDKPFVQLETTRGCFNTCAFCVSGGEKPVRTIGMKAIEKRLQEIHAHGIKNVRVLDRTFNYNAKRAKELLELFRQYPDMCFHLEIHPALLSQPMKEDLRTLPKGLLHLEAGIQSLREPVLQASRRAGKLSDALEGLRFLSSLENMETHADLIAGLPLYHLNELIEDVHMLAGFGCAEIQLESLKLLPGTEMRRNAGKLGIRYSPYPPYEVLQTNEITAGELQTARQLSRLLDGFYNATAWRAVTRKLMLENERFLVDFLDFLVQGNLIDQPLSLEKRGTLLYDFCRKQYPDYASHVTIAWIEAGMSLKKSPAESVVTKRQVPPPAWEVIYGTYNDSLRLCYLPVKDKVKGYWFGFESEIQKPEPVFKAWG